MADLYKAPSLSDACMSVLEIEGRVSDGLSDSDIQRLLDLRAFVEFSCLVESEIGACRDYCMLGLQIDTLLENVDLADALRDGRVKVSECTHPDEAKPFESKLKLVEHPLRFLLTHAVNPATVVVDCVLASLGATIMFARRGIGAGLGFLSLYIIFVFFDTYKYIRRLKREGLCNDIEYLHNRAMVRYKDGWYIIDDSFDSGYIDRGLSWLLAVPPTCTATGKNESSHTLALAVASRFLGEHEEDGNYRLECAAIYGELLRREFFQ